MRPRSASRWLFSSHRAARGGGWCRGACRVRPPHSVLVVAGLVFMVALAFVVPVTVVAGVHDRCRDVGRAASQGCAERAAGRGIRRTAGSARGPRRRTARRRPPDHGLRGRRFRGRRSRRHQPERGGGAGAPRRRRGRGAERRCGAVDAAGAMGPVGGVLAAGPCARAGHRDVDAHCAPRHRRAGPLTRRGSGRGWPVPARPP